MFAIKNAIIDKSERKREREGGDGDRQRKGSECSQCRMHFLISKRGDINKM